MRIFYLFKINDEFFNLTQDYPLELFLTLEKIYYCDKRDVDLAFNKFEQIVTKVDYQKINNKIYENYKDNINYMKFKNSHTINDFYEQEHTKIILNKTFIYLKTNKAKPIFFNDLKNIDNLFVCDFKNKDYFWLNAIYNPCF